MSLHNDDIDRLAASYREEYTPDVEQGLQRLHRSIAVVRTLPPRERPTAVRRRWPVAAAVGLLAAALVALLLAGDGRTYLRNSDPQPMAFELPDGSRLTLQQGAQVSYLTDEYGTINRRVAIEGQGYFEVVPDGTLPFLVGDGSTELRVTGTAFNLRANAALMEVEVSEGSVVLASEGKVVAVAARECGTARAGAPLEHKPAPNLNHHAWRTGELNFDHTPIDEVLGYFYDNWSITCTWADGTPCNYTVSGRYRGKEAGDVLADIAKLGGATLTPLDDTGKRYELSGPCTK